MSLAGLLKPFQRFVQLAALIGCLIVASVFAPGRDEASVIAGISQDAWSSGTSEVAGRKFVWEAGDNIWVEEGINLHRAAAPIDAQSPEGQAILRRNPNLDALLEDGTRILLLDDTSTPVELSSRRPV